MKENFVCCAVLVLLFCNGCYPCFVENSVNNRSVTTGSPFYEECCCTESDHSVNELEWLNPYGQTIRGPGTDSNVYTEEQGDCLSLHIPSAGKTLSGAYRCVTTNVGVPHSHTHNLDVYDQVYFFNAPATQQMVHGSDQWVTCEANGASPPFIRWYRGKDGQDEISNHTEKYGIYPEGLLVRNVTHDDNGIYKCSASVLSTGEEVEIDIDVKVLTIPTITEVSASPERVVVAGESLVLQCNAEALPEPDIEWWKLANTTQEGEQEGNDTLMTRTNNNSVVFASIRPEDGGAYKCVARNTIGIAFATITVEVLKPPEIIDFHNITVIDGQEIRMYCNASGKPIPNVTVTFEGKSFDEQSDSEYEIEIDRYAVWKVDRNMEGIYVCNATNEVATISEWLYMTVLHKPYFDKPYEEIWAWNGETVKFNCEQDSNPRANYIWRYLIGNYSTLAKGDPVASYYETTFEHTFTFSDQFAPYGVHECRASNEYGETGKVFNIRKGFPPTMVENATVIDRTATSVTFSIQPPTSFEGPDVIGFIAQYDTERNYDVTNIHPNRTWAVGVPFKLERLRPNTMYNIRFAAINRVGTGPWGDMIMFDTLAKSAPEPPIWQVDALQISTNKMLKWKHPEDNGEPIDYYALRYCPMDVNDSVDQTLCKEHRLQGVNELQVNDLQHNVTYYFELIAHNVEGNSTSANITLALAATVTSEAGLLSGGALIGISVIVVIICLILLDLMLFFWRKQGILASCCYKKNKKRKPNPLNSRDKKGLLKDNGECNDDTLRPNNGHKEFEYNKTTGIITGKHSSV